MPSPEERQAFTAFRGHLSADSVLRGEYEAAIANVVREYNTSIYENRFVTGGAVELFTLWALRAAGIDANVVGAQLPGADIQLPRGGRLSVKSSSTDPTSAIRLINVQGSASPTQWAHATMYVLATVGAGYADPDQLPNSTHSTGDAVEIRWPVLREHFKSHPDLLASVTVPVKSALTAGSKVANRAVALDVAHGHVDVVNVGGVMAMHGVFEPGWKWSVDVKPIAKTASCQAAHLGYVISGRMMVKIDDGTEAEASPGDVVQIAGGHDAWIVGNETCVIIDFGASVGQYAKPS